MELALFGVVGVVLIVGAGVFGSKLGVAAPLLLMVVGVGASFLPGAPTHIPHEIILLGLLPPILYSAAINVPVIDVRRNFSTISALSVVLVLVTAFITGFLLYALFPKLTLAGGVAIGAVISPTDAVAAIALGKKLGLPPRLVTILEGEGLVNDATALVLLRSAVAASALAVGEINVGGIVWDFGFSVVVAILIGLAVGVLTVFVRSKLHDPVLDTAISLAVPFIAFIPAEFIHASGVLSVVIAGLYSGHHSAKRFSPQARISERLNWRTVQFVLENGVFLLMGLQISAIVRDVQEKSLSIEQSILFGLLLTAVLIVIRFAFVAPLLLVLRSQPGRAELSQSRFRATIDRIRRRTSGHQQTPGVERRFERAERVYSRRANDIEQLAAEGHGWRGGVVLGWSGMRGVVTLAAAQSLPDNFEYRAQMVLIAFTVAIVTLLVQGGTLPLVVRLTGIRGTDRVADRRELATLLDEMGEAGVAVLESPGLELPDGEQIDPAVI
ncbi:MAG: sodium:proton antiporter, partial [Glaciihabitans sp.]|nr:sodium:proton antiporter [Glaciihabitans sp.]